MKEKKGLINPCFQLYLYVGVFKGHLHTFMHYWYKTFTQQCSRSLLQFTRTYQTLSLNAQ